MNNNEKPSFLKGKGAAVATVICFVAVITMVGAFTFRNYQNRMEQELAKAETAADEETKENSARKAGRKRNKGKGLKKNGPTKRGAEQ